MSRFSIPASAGYLLLTLLLFTMPHYAASLRASEGLPRSWTATEIWIESAECARKTGVVLVFCSGGGLVPYSDGSPADDPGHALALGIYSAVTHKAVPPRAISIFNSTINYCAIMLMAVLFFHLQMPLLSFLVLTLGTFVADELHSIAPHPAQFAAASFAAVLPVAILAFPPISGRRRSRLVWIAVGILCLGAATLLRQAIGLMGVVAACTAVAAQLVMFRPRMRGGVIACVILTAMIFVSYHTPVVLSLVRNAIYDVPRSKLPEQHGIWHSVYIGLGAVDNPFGIAWDDGNAKAAAERADPTVTFVSAKYFAILRDEYFRILRAHPAQVADIYYRKLNIILDTELPVWLGGWRFWKTLLLLSIVAICARGLLLFRQRGVYAPDAVLAVAMLFTAFFVGQGTLVHFSPQYLFPVHLFVLLWAGAIVEFVRLTLTSAWLRDRNAPLPDRETALATAL